MIFLTLVSTISVLPFTPDSQPFNELHGAIAVAGPQAQTSRPACRVSCDIRLERIAVLGRETDSIDLLDRSTIARLSGGEFAVTPTSINGTVAIYSPDGRLLRLLSREGLGPNELVRPTAIRRLPGDTLAVYELGVNRETLMNPDGRIVRRRRLEAIPKPYAYAVCGDDLVLSHHLRTPSRAGFLFHVIDPSSGRVGRSFGSAASGRSTVNGLVPAARPVSAINQSRFWASDPERARFELYETSGTLVRTLAPQLAWFVAPPSGAPEGVLSHRGRAVTRVYSIQADGEDLLWVFAVRAGPRSLALERKAGASHVPQDPGDEQDYETLISAVDGKTGLVLATTVHRGLLFGPHDGLLLRRPEAPSGWVASELLAYRLVERTGPRTVPRGSRTQLEQQRD